MNNWVSICALLLAVSTVFGQTDSADKTKFGRVGEDGVNRNFFRQQRFAVPQLFASEKRAEDAFMSDPRMFSTAFGKRSALEFEDPRFFSTAYGKRSSDLQDPRLYSTAFGKRSAPAFQDPRFFSTAYGR